MSISPECTRCDGCGHLVASARLEMSWARWTGMAGGATAGPATRMFRPRICPSCEGSGVAPQPMAPVRGHDYRRLGGLW